MEQNMTGADYKTREVAARIRELRLIHGLSEEEMATRTALSVEELQTMDENSIMEKFMAENFSFDPSPEQRKLFQEVLEWSREEDDLG